MAIIKDLGKLAFVSTYPPEECGLARFTRDLIEQMSYIGVEDTQVIAVTDDDDMDFSDKVTMKIRKNEKSDYLETAQKLNNSNIDLLILEHEYDIFGGENGDFILDFVNNIEIPFITTFNTIHSEPEEEQKAIMTLLAKKSEKIITMANNTKEILHKIYGIDSHKIEVIHYGVPKKIFETMEILKDRYELQDKTVITTFGLIGPGKGIEHGIEAIGSVVKLHNDILYLIIGENNPELNGEGDIYRKKLEDLVEEMGLSKNVKFINKYLSNEEIIDYLQLSDIYMTPFLKKDQAVSGTLAYAVAYGKAIVSTPYHYAKEMLANNSGILGEFNNPDSLAKGISFLLKNPVRKNRIEKNVMRIGRTMYWDKIAYSYASVLMKIQKKLSE